MCVCVCVCVAAGDTVAGAATVAAAIVGEQQLLWLPILLVTAIITVHTPLLAFTGAFSQNLRKWIPLRSSLRCRVHVLVAPSGAIGS